MFRTFNEYYGLLNKRLKYLHSLLLNFKSKRLAMINKDRAFFQYNSRDLVYIISPLTSQLCTGSWKIPKEGITNETKAVYAKIIHKKYYEKSKQHT